MYTWRKRAIIPHINEIPMISWRNRWTRCMNTTVFERTLCNGVASHLSYGRIYGCRLARGARTAKSAADTSHHAVGGHILHTVLATTLVSRGRVGFTVTCWCDGMRWNDMSSWETIGIETTNMACVWTRRAPIRYDMFEFTATHKYQYGFLACVPLKCDIWSPALEGV